MTKNSKEHRLYPKETMHFYMQAAYKHPRACLESLALPLSNVALGVLMPLYASKVLATLISRGPELMRNFWLLCLSTIAGVLLNYVGIRAQMVLQASVLKDLHMMVLDRLMKRSVGFYSNQVGGKLVSDASAFVSSYLQLMNAGWIQSSGFVASTVVGLIVIFVNNWMIGICLLILITALIIWTYFDSKRRSHLRTERMILGRKQTAHLADNIVNAITVKTFAQEKSERRTALKIADDLFFARMRDWTKTVSIETSRMALLLFAQIVMIFVLIRLTERNPALLATGIFAFTYTLTLINKLFSINTIVRQIEEVFVEASPMTQILLETSEVNDAQNAKELKVTRGSIEFNNVTFAYADAPEGRNVFNKLTLHIRAGEKIGLVGHSGGGKTTLTRLLLRFDDINAGSIEIDGQNIAEVKQTSLREGISYVPQEPLLFHRTIRENIAYGQPDATKKQIETAAKRAHAHEFINELPDGYDTIVGERGVKLSGGQRQRVAIARAILKDAPILLLDEATSALDSESEGLIQEALWTLMENRTAVVIAHRLSTIQRMDRIIVIEAGEITEEGSHSELIKQGGLYAKLWKQQSGGFLKD